MREDSYHYPRLIGSFLRNKITAIAFGRGREEELKFQGFLHRPVEKLWVYYPVSGTVKDHLDRLAVALDCRADYVDTRNAPSMMFPNDYKPGPEPMEDQSQASEPMTKELNPPEETTPTSVKTQWPPNLDSFKENVAEEASPRQSAILNVPPVAELASLGCSRRELLHLIERASEFGIAVCIQGARFDGQALLDVLKGLPTSPPPSPVTPIASRSKRGRPPTAREKTPDVIRLAQEGRSARGIARDLSIDPRSVNRILHDEAKLI